MEIIWISLIFGQVNWRVSINQVTTSSVSLLGSTLTLQDLSQAWKTTKQARWDEHPWVERQSRPAKAGREVGIATGVESKNTDRLTGQEANFPFSYSHHSASRSFGPWAPRSSAARRCLYLGGVLRLHATTACLELSWQLPQSEQLLFVSTVLVPAGLGLEPKMELYS